MTELVARQLPVVFRSSLQSRTSHLVVRREARPLAPPVRRQTRQAVSTRELPEHARPRTTGRFQGLRGLALIEKELDVQVHDSLARGHEGLSPSLERNLEALLVKQGLGLAKGRQSSGPIREGFLRPCLPVGGPQPSVGGAHRRGKLLKLVEPAQCLRRLP